MATDFNFSKERCINIIKAIESKPHVRYIRYLLTKRYSPTFIKAELFKLGLSAPHEPNLVIYYLNVIDPVIKQYNLGYVYSDYKNKILTNKKSKAFQKNILNFNLELSDAPDDQESFCKMVKDLEVDALWANEIVRFYGSTTNVPVDQNGERLIDTTFTRQSIEKILIHPKRYLVDKMLLECVPDSRICEYCNKNLDMKIFNYDIGLYKKVFFNIKTHDIESKIKTLEGEKAALVNLLKDIDNLSAYKDLEVGEKLVIKKQSEQRVKELDDNIKTLNMVYSEFSFRTAQAEQGDFEKMFTDVVAKGYERFLQLDGHKDRDVVDSLFKVAKIMSFAHDKVENIKTGVSTGNADKHSNAILMELYKQRTEDILDEQIKKTNERLKESGIEPLDEKIIPEDIEGIDELGVSFEVDEDNK